MQETAQVWIFQRQGARVLAHKRIPVRRTAQVDDIQIPIVRELLAKHERIPKVITRVDKKYRQSGRDVRDHVQQRHGLCLERRTHCDVGRESVRRPFDDFLRSFRFKFF